MTNEFIKKLENVHFNSQLELYMSEKKEYKNYDIYFSNLIEDYYWNFCTNIQTKDKEEFSKDWENIKKIMQTKNRMPLVYISPTSNLYEERLKLGLEVVYTDSWLLLENISNYDYKKSNLDLVIEDVDSNNIEEYIEAVMKGFSSDDPNDPYEPLAEGYAIALRSSVNSKKDTYFKIKHFLARFDNEVIGTATVNYDNEIALVYNVTTNRNYKKQGVCKEIMSYLIKNMNKQGIKYICLQTEKGFYTEQVYLNLGFKKIFEANALK